MPKGGTAPRKATEGAALRLGEQPLRALMAEFESGLLRAALERGQGNIASAARLLQTDRGNLHRRLRALGIVTGPPAASGKRQTRD
jgi:DNA-binding NtrC family response regulator